MKMPSAFRHPRRARGIKPESDLVCMCFRRRSFWRILRQQRLEAFAGRRLRTADDYVQLSARRNFVSHRSNALEQVVRDNHRFGARILDHVPPLLAIQQRVERHRRNARLDSPPEGDGKIHIVAHDENDAALTRNAEGGERISEAVAARLQLAIRQASLRIDESRLAAESFGDVSVHHVDSGVIRPRGGRPQGGLNTIGHCVSPLLRAAFIRRDTGASPRHRPAAHRASLRKRFGP